MSTLTFYAHPKCSTCQGAREWLQRHGLAFVEKDIRTTPPALSELRAMLEGQGGELRRLCNTSGIEYRAQGLAAKLPTLTADEALRLLAGNGMLVKRPFVLGSGVALVGFKEEAWTEALLEKMKAKEDNRIELRLRELSQLFNLMDPSPFIDRDLDADAEEFIVGWAHELPHKRELELVIHLTTPPPADRAAGTEEAVRHYFASRAEVKRRELRRLLRRGRASLLIGMLFLAGCFGLSELTQTVLPEGWNKFTELGLQIVGWVAMWRPLEIYLYDWWPIRSDERLMQRLARMKVSLNLPAA